MSTSTAAQSWIEDSAPDDSGRSDFPRLPYESETFAVPDGAGHAIPIGLDTMDPGPELGAILAEIDLDMMSGYDRVVVLRAHQRMVSHHQAKTCDAMVSIHTAMGDLYRELAEHDIAGISASEIRCALNLTRRSADVELSFALELARRVPKVLQALFTGSLDLRRAKTIERGTIHLSTAIAQSVVERVIEDAPDMTTGQLAARIRKLCIEADPADALDRYLRSVADRRIVTDPTVDGTASLSGENLPPDRVAIAASRINAIARSLRGKGESRSMDQLRADIFLDLLSGEATGTAPGRGKGTVHVTCDLGTLAGLTDHAGDLAGYGPVVADIARQLADANPDAEWRWTITHPEEGHPIAAGLTRRRPTAAQRRQIELRDPTCTYPGCRMPSQDCDIDHIARYADGGVTCPCNNTPNCRHDHALQNHGWTYERLPNGMYVWRSPFGHTYSTWRAPP
ncbi:MAG: DUF222 domain-containing protein [Actinomycetota bacterium]